MTDIKEKLFWLWTKKIGLLSEYDYLSRLHGWKSINEIKDLMLADGVPESEINKIIFDGAVSRSQERRIKAQKGE